MRRVYEDWGSQKVSNYIKVRPKSRGAGLIFRTDQYFQRQTSVHVQDKNREISPLGREEGYGEKDLEKR